MVTEQEFLKAMEIINEYKKQIFGLIDEINTLNKFKEDKGKTPVTEFIEKSNCSKRVREALLIFYKDCYIEDVEPNKFRRCRNIGYGAHVEFITKRDYFLNYVKPI